jgi:ADP-heptose:LPS heptosyltransferase
MLTQHPAITNVFTIDRRWKRLGVLTQLRGEWRLLRQLRARHHDLLVHLAESVRGVLLSFALGLFGPSGDLKWGPWQVTSHIVTSNHSCRPCGLDGCGNGKVSDCLTSIPVDTVLAAVRQFI